MNYYVIGQDKSLEPLEDAAAPIIADCQKAITSGTAAPQGGEDGDIYIHY